MIEVNIITIYLTRKKKKIKILNEQSVHHIFFIYRAFNNSMMNKIKIIVNITD